MNIEPTFDFAAVNRDRLRKAWREVLWAPQWTFFLTLTWNRSVSEERMRDDLRALHGRVDEHFLGRYFARRPVADRTQAVFFTEKLRSNPHSHSMWRVEAEKRKQLRFARLFSQDKLWNDIVPSGTAHLGFARGRDATNYGTKEQHPEIEAGRIIWSDEFVPTWRRRG